MAELINCIDKNSNLKLLKNPGSWKTAFWLQIFTNCNIFRATKKHNLEHNAEVKHDIVSSYSLCVSVILTSLFSNQFIS